jgi:hypothetical protein
MVVPVKLAQIRTFNVCVWGQFNGLIVSSCFPSGCQCTPIAQQRSQKAKTLCRQVPLLTLDLQTLIFLLPEQEATAHQNPFSRTASPIVKLSPRPIPGSSIKRADPDASIKMPTSGTA